MAKFSVTLINQVLEILVCTDVLNFLPLLLELETVGENILRSLASILAVSQPLQNFYNYKDIIWVIWHEWGYRHMFTYKYTVKSLI